MANFKGIYLLQKLDVPDAERIRELDQLAKNPQGFINKIGSSKEPAIMGNVFWSCSSLFGPLKKKVGSKRVFMFTDEDRPHEGQVALQRAAKIRARDLADLGIFIELFNLNRPGRPGGFDISLFYADVLPFVPTGEDDDGADRYSSVRSEADATEKFAELLTKVRRKESKKRAMGRVPMILGNGMALACRVYSLYMESKKGPYVWMEAESGKLVKPVTEWVSQGTGESLPRQQLSYYYDFGGEKAIFTKDELGKVKSLGEPGLTIVGFRPATWLKLHYNMTHSNFVFPDESSIRGSILAFSALLKALLDLGQIAIGAYISRRTVPPKIVALLPQAELTDPETGVQLKPAGLSMIVLPFAEDLRRLTFDGHETKPAESGLVDKAKEIISKLTITGGFDPETFENPVIQRHYATLQALALDQMLDEEDLKDSVKPENQRMQKRAGNLIDEFIAMVPATEPSSELSKSRGARKSTAADSGGQKKSKQESTGIDDSIASDAAKLGKFTVAELKYYAIGKGLKPSKLKADIIQQIIASNAK